MQTKKIVINFNYPDDADISLQEIQDKITKTLKEELKSENVEWEITEETVLPFINPTYPTPSYPPPSFPQYPPINPCDDTPWYQPSKFWWYNQPTCLNQEDVAKLKSLLKKNDNDKKA
jgi:hypothetical protein